TSVAPSTATIRTTEAAKTFQARPKRGPLSVELASRIRRIGLSVLVLVGLLLEAPRVELHRLRQRQSRRRDIHILHDFLRHARVPDVQGVVAGRYAIDGKAAIRTRLGEPAARHDLYVSHHA